MRPRYAETCCMVALALLATAAFLFLWELGKPLAIAAVGAVLVAVKGRSR